MPAAATERVTLAPVAAFWLATCVTRVGATVAGTVAGTAARIVKLFVSAMKMLPFVAAATPRGKLNWATEPVPSLLPTTSGAPGFEVMAPGGSPASVVTTPAGVMRRMEQLFVSGT